MNKEFALVTEASKGLGKAFAFELTKRKINTILVGLPDEGLDLLTNELKNKYEVESVFYETDLTIKENILNLAAWVNENFSVSILINNAGVGGTKEFLNADVNYIDHIIQLNIRATSILTHQILPNLLKQPQAYILYVSSMAAFSPIGFKTVNPASKVFIDHFSRGLRQELSGTSVFISTVYPGSMKTNRDVTERINKLGTFGKLGLLPPEKVAEISINQLFNKNPVIHLNASNVFNRLIMKIIPVWIRLPIITRVIKKREIDRE